MVADSHRRRRPRTSATAELRLPFRLRLVEFGFAEFRLIELRFAELAHLGLELEVAAFCFECPSHGTLADSLTG
jgi:hypothetical protein